jgi:hypothetical protein
MIKIIINFKISDNHNIIRVVRMIHSTFKLLIIINKINEYNHLYIQVIILFLHYLFIYYSHPYFFIIIL